MHIFTWFIYIRTMSDTSWTMQIQAVGNIFCNKDWVLHVVTPLLCNRWNHNNYQQTMCSMLHWTSLKGCLAWIIDLDFPRFKLDTTECDPYFTGPWLHVSLTVMFLPPLWSDANLMAGPGMNFYNMMLANIRSKLVTIQWGWHCWWLNWISIHQQMPTLPITQALLSSDNKSSLK